MTTITCDRCGLPCRPSNRINANARLLKRASSGLCSNCAVTAFLKMPPLGQLIDDPQKLLWGPIRAQFARMMAAGGADMDPREIDWDVVVANWELPPASRKEREKIREVLNA